MKTVSERTRWEIWFSGRVQGVGFRYQTRQIAKGFEVSGIVQNLGDGRVYLVAEGVQDEVSEFVEAIAQQMAGYIREVEKSTDLEPVGLMGFLIVT